MALVITGQASFAGVNFAIIQGGDGPVQKLPDDDFYVSANDIPYGSDTYVQVGGRQSGQRVEEIMVTAANVAAFLSKAGTVGSLTIHGVTRTATLSNIKNKRQRPGDYLLCQVTFYS